MIVSESLAKVNFVLEQLQRVGPGSTSLNDFYSSETRLGEYSCSTTCLRDFKR